MDKINYQESSFDKIVSSLKEILIRIGYEPKNICFFPVSAWQGDNVVEKSEKMPWYQDLTVMEFLESKIKPFQLLENLPKTYLSVQDSYSDGENTILVGRVEEGVLELGQEIFFADKQRFKVLKIRDLENELKTVRAGQNFGIETQSGDFATGNVRGTAMAGLSSAIKSDILSGEIFWIDKPSGKNLTMERGADSIGVKLLEPKLAEIGEKEKTTYKALLNKKMFIIPETKTILGKIVIKDRGKIIAVGNIT